MSDSWGTIIVNSIRSVTFAFSLCLAASLCFWAFTTPIASGGDEAAHIVKAASLWRGEIRGPVESRVVDGQRTRADTVVVPASLSELYEWADCWQRQEMADECDVVVPTGAPKVSYTAAGPYPSLYYGLVGWVTLFLDGSAAIYGMRLVTAMLNLALTLTAVRYARLGANRHLGLACVAIGLTPMVTYAMATVNPNGLEVAAAFVVWASAYSIVSDSEPRLSSVIALSISSAVFLNARSLSPFFFLVGMIMLWLVAQPGTIRHLLSRSVVRWSVAFIGVAGATAVAWVLSQGHLGFVPGEPVPVGQSPAVQLVRLTPVFLKQMVSGFYGLDGGVNNIIPAAWVVFGGAVGSPLLRVVSRSDRARLAMAGAIFLALPFVLQLPTAASNGVAWHGRYVVLMIPALSLALLYSARNVAVSVRPSLRIVAGAAAALATGLALGGAARHVSGSFSYFSSGVPLGPLPNASLVVLQIVASVGFGAVISHSLKPVQGLHPRGVSPLDRLGSKPV